MIRKSLDLSRLTDNDNIKKSKSSPAKKKSVINIKKCKSTSNYE